MIEPIKPPNLSDRPRPRRDSKAGNLAIAWFGGATRVAWRHRSQPVQPGGPHFDDNQAGLRKFQKRSSIKQIDGLHND